MDVRAWVTMIVAAAVTVAPGAYAVSAASASVQSSLTTIEAAAPEKPMNVLPLQSSIEPGTDKQVVSLFTGPRRTLVQITLRNGATLAAHKAPVPITIQCIAGSGTLTISDPGAGPAVPLKPGVLVTLEPGVVHEIVASPSVSVLLTQFTDR